MRTHSWVLVLLLTVCAAPCLAQGADSSPGASLVHLDVTVLDAAGRPVRDLVPADFDIRVDGMPADIASAVRMSASPGSRASALPAGGAARGRLSPAQVARDVLRNDAVVERYVVIVLDDVAGAAATTGPDSWMMTSGLDLARAVVERLGPDDRGAVFFTFMGQRQGLTADRDRLLAAIDGFATRTAPANCLPREAGSTCLMDALEQVAAALPSSGHQRKTVVVISEHAGLPSVTLPSTDAPADTAERRLLARLQATGAVLYSITSASAASPRAGTAGAVNVAEATGGRALVHSAPQAQVDSVLGDSEFYYVFALRPRARDGSFHPVSVSVGRPDVTVRAPRGIFMPDGAAQPPSALANSLEDAMSAPHAVSTLPMGVSVAVFGAPGRREAVLSIVSAVTSSTAPGEAAWQAQVAATAFDTQWQPRASHRQTIEVTAPPTAGSQTAHVVSALELLPGRYEVRVAGESGGRAGSVFVDVDVPEFQTAPLSASGLVVTTAPQPYAPNPLLAGVLPVTPTARRAFRSTESVEVLVRFYQGSRARVRNLPVSLRIADAGGEGVIQGSEIIQMGQFDRSRASDWRFPLPLDRLAQGEYLLSVEAVLDDRRVVRHLRFEVVR